MFKKNKSQPTDAEAPPSVDALPPVDALAEILYERRLEASGGTWMNNGEKQAWLRRVAQEDTPILIRELRKQGYVIQRVSD